MKQKVFFIAVLMTALAIPQGVMAYDFSYTYQGQTLYYNISGSNVTVTYPGDFSDCPYSGYTEPTGGLEIPSSVTYNGTTYSVTSIGNYAFQNCSGLTSVTIPNSVTSIGDRAFDGCSGIISMTIPNSVTSIGSNAFSGCTSLTSVTIPNSVTSIGDGAFYACSGLTSLTIGNSVTSIGNKAFYGCSGLTSVTIPNSVISIGSYAFHYCSGLTSLTIGNSVTSIGSYAFYSCSGLTSVTIPNSVTSIGLYAFNLVRHIEYHGTASGAPWSAISMNGTVDGDFVFSSSAEDTLLAYIGVGGNVVIPNTVTSIGSYAFYSCSSLTSVTIPNSVTSIGSSVFYGCGDLTEVNFNATNCTTMGSLYYPVFTGCTNLATLNIGETVTQIPAYAFRACSGLTSVTIPNSVTSIGGTAFSGCSALTEITSLNEAPPQLGAYCFLGINMNIPVYVPCDAVSAYQAASGWNEFTNYQCPPVGIGDVAEAECGVSVYQRDGRIVVESGDGMPLGDVRVFDAVGRMLAAKQSDIQTVSFDLPAAGTYLVKVGNAPVRKVIVMQ